jgi:hypothetical protein
MARGSVVSWLFVGTLVMPCALHAQAGRGDTTVVISGTVRDLATRRGIAGAVVSTADGTRASSNENGDFALRLPALARVMLHVRRIGYDSLALEVDASSVGRPRFEIGLRPLPPMLDTMMVTAETRRWPSKVEDFDRRRSRHINGVFSREPTSSVVSRS